MFFKPFTFLLAMLYFSANAQILKDHRSYIVTKTHDTIYGKINKNIFTGHIKLITSNKSFKIEPDQYSAYYDAKKRAFYRSKILPSLIPEKLAKKLRIPKKSEWLQCIEDGKIALYEQKGYMYGRNPDNILGGMTTLSSIIVTDGISNTEFTSWYIEKDGYALTPIKHNTFASIDGKTRKERKDLLGSLLADKIPEEAYKSRFFSFDNVRILVREYNGKY